MAHAVFPSDHILDATPSAAATAPAKATGVPNMTDGTHAMYVKVALLGPPVTDEATMAPSLLATATTPGGATTTMVPASGRIDLFVPDPGGGADVYVGSIFRSSGAPNGVYTFTIALTGAFNDPAAQPTWELVIRNNDPTGARRFTWVAADSEAEAEQPWIDIIGPESSDPVPPDPDVLTSALTLTATTNQEPIPLADGELPPTTLSLRIANYGTGPLTVTGVVSETPEFSTAIPLGGITVLPNSSMERPAESGANRPESLPIWFNPPATIGITNRTYQFTSNDTTLPATLPARPSPTQPIHNNVAELEGRAIQVEIMMLLDGSGSMAAKPNGEMPGPGEQSRWTRVQEAAIEYFDILGQLHAEGRFGVAVFPNRIAGGSGLAGSVFGPVDINAGTITDAQAAVSALAPPSGGTPMVAGFEMLIGADATSHGFFRDDGLAPELNERWIILLSDGAHNTPFGTSPNVFYEGTAADGESFLDKNVKVFAIGYGDEGGAYYQPDHTLLQNVVAASDGEWHDAGSDDAGVQLKSTFRSVLQEVLYVDTFLDPEATVTEDNPLVERGFVVLPYDTRVVVVCDWSTPQSDRVQLTLVAPDGTVLSPSDMENTDGVSYQRGATFAVATIERAYLKNPGSPDEPRHGYWSLRIEGHDLDATADVPPSETFHYEILTDSRLKLSFVGKKTSGFAGDAVRLTARLTLDGRGIPDAGVQIRIGKPGESPLNWLARQEVSQAELDAAREEIPENERTELAVKALALKNKGITLDQFLQQSVIAAVDPYRQGSYSATFTDTRTPGSYDFWATAFGEVDGHLFRREARFKMRVAVQPDPQSTVFDVQYGADAEGDDVTITKVTVRPQDRFGNPMLIDLANSDNYEVAIQGGSFVQPLVSNLDGSYSAELQWDDPQSPPQLSLRAKYGEGEDDETTGYGMLPVDELHYPDTVAEYIAGREAQPGINTHNNGEHILGSILTKPAGQFLSLGAQGSIDVSLAGQVVTAGTQEKRDVTVFVEPGTGLNAYQVLGFLEHEGTGGEWIELGTSSGETKSFSMRDVGLGAATMIRIQDLSGRTRDFNQQPLETPGVSIRGIGFMNVRPPEEVTQPTYNAVLSPTRSRWPVATLDGIGASYSNDLQGSGIRTLGDLAQIDVDSQGFGVPGYKLREFRTKARQVLTLLITLPYSPVLAQKPIMTVIEASHENIVSFSGNRLTSLQAAELKEELAPLQLALDDSVLRNVPLRVLFT